MAARFAKKKQPVPEKKEKGHLMESFIQQGIEQKLEQLTRFVYTTHCLGQKSFGLDALENLVTVQLQNGFDIGTQYYSSHHAKTSSI